MVVCICRNIKTSEYKSEEELKQRIMENDFHCGLCQTKYLIEENESKRTNQETVLCNHQQARRFAGKDLS